MLQIDLVGPLKSSQFKYFLSGIEVFTKYRQQEPIPEQPSAELEFPSPEPPSRRPPSFPPYTLTPLDSRSILTSPHSLFSVSSVLPLLDKLFDPQMSSQTLDTPIQPEETTYFARKTENLHTEQHL